MRELWKLSAVATALLGAIACGGDDDDSGTSGGLSTCGGGAKTMMCMCSDGQVKSVACPKVGPPPACPCFANGEKNTVMTGDMPLGTGGAMAGSGGAPMMSGAAGEPAMMTGTGGVPPMMAGTGGVPPMMAGTGGVMMTGTGGAMMTGSGGSSAPATDNPDIEMARQVCVDTINMYRATVTSTKLAPLTRGTPDDEVCSDKGAKQDGDSGVAHGSAGMCPGYAGGQDACPGWGVGGFSGNATLADAIKGCLGQMWAEGEPPVSRAECQKDYQNCFLKYGHYLNMSDPGYTGVACGFYLMMDGKSWWMNQDFKSKPWGAP
jgi:hypothetical protein